MADGGEVTLRLDGPVAHVTFARPAARNAMTFAMYAQLAAICDQLDGQRDLCAIVFRGAGGAFVAGTDISEFTAFQSGADGLVYEDHIDTVLARLARLPAPTLAVIEGAAVGGGLAISAACDLRIVTPGAKFGVPIARTVGNCLSAANIARLIRAFGDGPVRRMLLLSEFLDGATVHGLGFSSACVPPDRIEADKRHQQADEQNRQRDQRHGCDAHAPGVGRARLGRAKMTDLAHRRAERISFVRHVAQTPERP